jgi:arylsulfatase A-like enzyme/Flp pilus assembly protein TadD
MPRSTWGVHGFGALSVLVSALLLTTCFRELQPNILLVTFDTTRYDRFGCTGDADARTPTVDALAARGLLFERAYASASLTLPSHTTMLTGLEPVAHGVRDNGKYRVADELHTLPEMLREAGYATAAFVSAFVLGSQYNLNQGFDAYDDRMHTMSQRRWGVPQRSGVEVADQALAWLAAADAARPFFLWAHFYDPHAPRFVEPPFDELGDTYRGEIAYADAQLARLLEGVERNAHGRPTLIVFTADHGESLGQHGEETHGLVAYDSTLHVPLILAGPGIPRGERAQHYARHVDLLPTILERVGLPVPDGLSGRSLVRAVAASEPESDEGAVGWFESHGAEGLGWAPIEGVRTGRWKYTASPEPVELFNLLEDPNETANLAEQEPEVRELLAALYTQQKDAAPGIDSQRPDLDLEELERLAALGYIQAPARSAGGKAPDPRDFVAVHGWVESARGFAFKGEYGAAIDLLETLVESPSVRPLVLRSLAAIYEAAGRQADAILTYRRYVEVSDSDEARFGLARALVRAARPKEALAVLDSLRTSAPEAVQVRAAASARLGRMDEARTLLDAGYAGNDTLRRRTRAQLVLSAAPLPDGERDLRELLEGASDDAVVTSRLGYYLALWGTPEQGDEALGLLRRAAVASPQDAEIQANLGWGAYRLGGAEESVRALESAVRLDDADPTNRYRLALALARQGESLRSLDELRAALAASPGADWAKEGRALARQLERTLAAKAKGGPS